MFFINIATWSLVLAVLVGFGIIIGFVMASVLLFIITGFLNTSLTTYLWFEVRSGFLGFLTHGMILFLVLFALDSLLITVPTLGFPGFATTVVTFVFGSFTNGFVAKRIAAYWRQQNRVSTYDTNGVETQLKRPQRARKSSVSEAL